MSFDRDLCWLDKIHKPIIGSYEINADVSPIKNTIEREIGLLFSIKDGGAALIFNIDENAGQNDGYSLSKKDGAYIISSATQKGLLYGLFGLRRAIICDVALPVSSIPSQSLRMLNHWDNFDGTIERGYAGSSIFYDNNAFRNDENLIRQYARLIASVGINAVSINNVNLSHETTQFITKKYLPEIKIIADIFSEYGILTFLSINFAAPVIVGGLNTADPREKCVADFWAGACKEIYSYIPDFGGFVVKADSEGEAGPFAYGASHGDGANMLADAIRPYGGIIVWRCFVYNCAQDWHDRATDRARAAYDIFAPLDGSFNNNVTLQIKNGPIDFQIREPVSPLFGAIKSTNHILEFQITQEYTGHQKDVCYLAPMWKETLEFDTAHGQNARVREVLYANSPEPKYSGTAAVVGVGMDDNWMGNKLAQANLYAFGRISFDNDLTPETIASEWIAQTFNLKKDSFDKLLFLLNTSRKTYEDYTAPLSVGFMCNPRNHYGVSVDGYEYDRWGTYHYADRSGVGRDRTKKSGTGFVSQYSKTCENIYEDIEKTPDELLLFFHHVPYVHKLHSGKTLIQHIYDSHFSGVEGVREYIRIWESLKDELDNTSYENVRLRLDIQLKNAIAWRDEVNTYFFRKSGIPDELGRNIYP